MSDDAPFGEWIKQQRKALGLNQAALAQQIGCSRGTLGKVEAGAQRPSDQIVERLAQVLKVSPSLVRARELRTASDQAYSQREYAQAQQHMEKSLALYREVGDKPAVAALLSKLGWAMAEQANYPVVDSLFEEHLAIQQELGDKLGMVRGYNFLGVMSLRQGNYQRAARYYEQGLALCRESGLKRGVGAFLNTLGYTLGKLGDYPRAAALLEEGVTVCQELGSKEGSAECLGNLAHIVLEQGDTARALDLCQQSIILFQDVDGSQVEIAEDLDELAEIIRRQGDARRAAQILGAAEMVREVARESIPPSKRAVYESTVSATRADLDEATFAAAWAEGRKMNLEQAVDYALNRKDQVAA
jgi:transcriptional regulator with XRE-family HTH domain